jgi:hypothetical protein
MAGAAKRTWIIEPGYDPDTGAATEGYDRSEAVQILRDLEATLFRVGGMVSIAADRVRAGQAPDGSPLAISERLIVSWQAFSPLRDPEVYVPEPVEEEPAVEPVPEEVELEEQPDPKQIDALADDEWSPDDEE